MGTIPVKDATPFNGSNAPQGRFEEEQQVTLGRLWTCGGEKLCRLKQTVRGVWTDRHYATSGFRRDQTDRDAREKMDEAKEPKPRLPGAAG